jgi:hypothetical protein
LISLERDRGDGCLCPYRVIGGKLGDDGGQVSGVHATDDAESAALETPVVTSRLSAVTSGFRIMPAVWPLGFRSTCKQV